MCIFTPAQPSWFDRITGRFRRQGSVEIEVASTRIFARVEGATQWLGYQMQVGAASDVAMILPVPVVAGSGDDALRFLDLSDHETFFDDLAGLFPSNDPSPLMALRASVSRSLSAPLVVHSVGSFEASYVPTRADFSRLDRRFHLPEAVWDGLPRYADWGFAVFKLKKGKAKRIHPMAFRFPTRDPGRIFFPTIHVHDGELKATANFDHALYFQPPILGSGGILSMYPASEKIGPTGARGLVDLEAHVGHRVLFGERLNEDTWIDLAEKAG